MARWRACLRQTIGGVKRVAHDRPLKDGPKRMTVVKDTQALSDLCDALATERYVTVDTEFLRDSTYWPQLCLVQVAGSNGPFAIDPLADDLDLAPFLELLANQAVLKVFHAARQDIEIFFHLTGNVPAPLFDTQVAAMVCGFGDQVGYEQLVRTIARKGLDKSSRFTDWARRPLSDRQLSYALADVIHLRPIFEELETQLDKSGRAGWVTEEMAVLTDPATYELNPDLAWRRIKTRTNDPAFRTRVATLAAWRERRAQEKDLPRNRVIRDEAILEIAANKPTDTDGLRRVRGLSDGQARGKWGQEILQALKHAREAAPPPLVQQKDRIQLTERQLAIVDLLKVLLKARAASSGVAPKLIASSADLEAIAHRDDADVRALSGWRAEIYGNEALALKRGEIGLTVGKSQIETIEIE